MSHTGKVCLVTGASSGIGREIAKQLAEKGCTVYGTTRRLRPGEVAKDGAVFMIALDTTDPQSVEQAVQLVEQREGRIDILVNNAGSGVAGPLEETSEEAAKAQMDV
ncbi:MAG TPA: SDR family NAD(P)-dependent oxidoreductase, partial [Clostridiales bacterium]|nr:SDR family NAD(P)-dependent oxidoreductase [Clostridiales bacterium]